MQKEQSGAPHGDHGLRGQDGAQSGDHEQGEPVDTPAAPDKTSEDDSKR